MTLISSFGLVPSTCGISSAPQQFDLSDLSLIIPAKNNRQGLCRLLTTCLEVFSPQHCPREILVIDNLSSPPLERFWQATWGLPVNILACTRPGPAAARNLGARHASGHWLIFLFRYPQDRVCRSRVISEPSASQASHLRVHRLLL